MTESDDFYDKLKITAVKKFVWNDVVFADNKAEIDALSEIITKFLRLDGVIPFDKKITLAKPFGTTGSFSRSPGHEEAFNRICNTLSEASKENGIGFIVNFSRQEDFMEGGGFGAFLQFGEVNFHPEIILDGKKLVFFSHKDIKAPLRYLCPYKDFLTPYTGNNALISEIKSHIDDYSYWQNLGECALLQKGFVHFDEAERSVCASMLDCVFKLESPSFCDEVRKKIIERY